MAVAADAAPQLVELRQTKPLGVLDLAQREASRWFESTAPTRDAIDRLVLNWEQRFRLIEIG